MRQAFSNQGELMPRQETVPSKCRIPIFIICVLFFVQAAYAQTATLSGSVSDSTGAAIPGVSITATDVGRQTPRATVSDERGNYRLALLPPGRYELRAALTGFKTYVRSEITLEIDQTLRLD